MSNDVAASNQELDAEDAKIVKLARASRARHNTAEGAAVRDTTGRTYAATTVELPSLQLSALALAVGMAVASGAEGLEAAAVVTNESAAREADVAVIRDLGGPGIPVLVSGPDGAVRATTHT